MAAMRVPLWLKMGWTVWVITWVPFYWKEYGLQNFLFFCDLGNFFLMLALWMESALIFSWQANGLLLIQTLGLSALARTSSAAQNTCSIPTCLYSFGCSACFTWLLLPSCYGHSAA